MTLSRLIMFSGIVFADLLPAPAQVPKYSNEFMKIGAGAASLSMAGSNVAMVGDVTAGYINPAGLNLIGKGFGVSLMHAEYFAGIAKYDYGAAACRIDGQSVLGVSVIRFGVDDIPNTLELIDEDGNIRYDRIRTFSVADYAFMGSYARETGVNGLTLGGSVKLIHRVTGEFARAWGFGLDAGVQYRKGKWMFGALARDITTTFNAWHFNTGELETVFRTTGNEMPENSLEITLPSLLAGAGRYFRITGGIGIMAELDADITFDGRRHVLISSGPVSIDPHAGVEADYKDLVFLRLGIGNIQRTPGFGGGNELSFQPDLGLGVRFRNISVDYALTDLGDQSVALYSNIFSLSFYFDAADQDGDAD